MFCIAAFIIILLLSVFSAKYRRQVSKAWACVGRKVTLRACDTNFKQEVKDNMLAKVATRKPQYVKAADIAIEVGAILLVIVTVWSVYVGVKSGLNLYVYGTCNPSNAAACSLGSEACSIESGRGGFIDSIRDGSVVSWVGGEFSEFGETIAAIPTRMQTWNASDYLPENATFARPYDDSKPVALEIIDPGCQFCSQLAANLKQADFANNYNLSYIAYPIETPNSDGEYKFPNSKLVTQYLEAMRLLPLEGAEVPADWQVLDRIFTGQNEDGFTYYQVINTFLDQEETAALLESWMAEFGYSDGQVTDIRALAGSEDVERIIDNNQAIVNDQIKTLKIPTIIFDGRRWEGVLSVEDLES